MKFKSLGLPVWAPLAALAGWRPPTSVQGTSVLRTGSMCLVGI